MLVKFLKTHSHAVIPEYKTADASGMDLCIVERVTLQPGEHKVVDTGLRIKIAEGYEGQVRPRSGLAAKHGVTIVNSPGTIDADYTGPLKVILQNLGKEEVTFCCPERIAQLVIVPVVQVSIKEVTDESELGDTERGQGGFGSTGV